MPKAFQTKGGEVYEKCGIPFGAKPTVVGDVDLESKRGNLGFTIGERLDMDDRLVEVKVPEGAKPVKPKPPAPKDDAGNGGKADDGGKNGGGKNGK
jgi:hypothetical protein